MTTVPYQRKSMTSRNGARLAAPRAPSQREVIVAFVREHGPSTRNEIAEGTGLPLASVCGRVIPLIYPNRYSFSTEGALLRRAGSRICRVTGNEAEVVAVVVEPVQKAMW